MPLFTAPYIYTPDNWLHNHVLDISAAGYVEALRPRRADDIPIEYQGYLIPGWVNAHCHIELSALAGEIPEGTGMTGFIGSLFRARAGHEVAVFEQAAQQALQQMADQGTVALGDISNQPWSIEAKQQVDIWTHSFVEVLGVAPDEAASRLTQGMEVAQAFANADLAHSLTPHAPYSVSSQLFEALYGLGQSIYSLHLLESGEEVELFETGAGPFEAFYRQIGLAFEPFVASSPWEHAQAALSPRTKILLVHNVELSPPRAHMLNQHHPNSWLVFCPRANWYIHRRLPPIPRLAQVNERICLGTDSLASNHSLDLGEEVRFLLGAFPQLDFHQVICWATTHGAMALGVQDQVGQFLPGSRPGVLLWEEQQTIRLW